MSKFSIVWISLDGTFWPYYKIDWYMHLNLYDWIHIQIIPLVWCQRNNLYFHLKYESLSWLSIQSSFKRRVRILILKFHNTFGTCGDDIIHSDCRVSPDKVSHIPVFRFLRYMSGEIHGVSFCFPWNTKAIHFWKHLTCASSVSLHSLFDICNKFQSV